MVAVVPEAVFAVTVKLPAVLAMVAGALGFIAVADNVMEGKTLRIDDRLIRCLRNPADPTDPIGPVWLEDVVRDLTSLGSAAVLGLVTTVVVGFLLIRRTYHAMGLVLIATVGGLLLSLLLKGYFSRPRPDMVPRLAEVYTSRILCFLRFLLFQDETYTMHPQGLSRPVQTSLEQKETKATKSESRA